MGILSDNVGDLGVGSFEAQELCGPTHGDGRQYMATVKKIRQIWRATEWLTRQWAKGLSALQVHKLHSTASLRKPTHHATRESSGKANPQEQCRVSA